MQNNGARALARLLATMVACDDGAQFRRLEFCSAALFRAAVKR